jgi:predicted alpha/beta superfamily hydrolase
MKNISFVIGLFILVCTGAENSQAAETSNSSIVVNIGEKINLPSKNLDEIRELLVHLPDDYASSDTKYPVIYLLDGENHFRHAVAALNILQQNKRVPSSIIIGISNNTGKRTRDAYTKRDNFKKFVASEVTTFVDKNYRTTEFRTIFGHSAMGLVALDMFTKEVKSFDYTIVASPAIDHTDEKLMKKISQLTKSENFTDRSLYFSVTDKEGELDGLTEGVKLLDKLIRKDAHSDFDWHFEFISGETHMTTPYVTIYQGLSKTLIHYPELEKTCLIGFCFG